MQWSQERGAADGQEPECSDRMERGAADEQEAVMRPSVPRGRRGREQLKVATLQKCAASCRSITASCYSRLASTHFRTNFAPSSHTLLVQPMQRRRVPSTRRRDARRD
jgi:hypothetical protein